ncbi:DUF4843 domain-containing protein [Flavobacterium quisquiliarum]|uniref:DUF4843 domain-containing protein n=1 Tax=Flavobacterium quisquiliarum TaxID=1834436 RepID=A0ABV8WCP9_9FLAO|nr:DUF4843 domain-containing protein [Flavobacterium quisquiliarum]MBW1655257.1 DUF4843 domain-containing protein [Flavobacterium quisquiliarum]NWL00643.1 hypothetical protein [Flavobacterium collinsii]
MKKILILCVVILSFLGIASCNQEAIETYSGTDNIYFSNAVYPSNGAGAPLIDSTGFSFAFDKEVVTQRIFKIPFRVQGKMSNVDRKVKVSVDPSSTAVAGTHFTLPENITLHAGKVVDTFAVTVLRAPSLKTKTFTLVLNLEENEFFTTKMQTVVTNVLTGKTMNFARFKLSFNDNLSQPLGWYEPILGKFTSKKLFLICDVMQLNPEIFTKQLAIADISYCNSFMKRYLADQKASGNTIYEDDGTEMFFP